MQVETAQSFVVAVPSVFSTPSVQVNLFEGPFYFSWPESTRVLFLGKLKMGSASVTMMPRLIDIRDLIFREEISCREEKSRPKQG